jgi:hypothetical protein
MDIYTTFGWIEHVDAVLKNQNAAYYHVCYLILIVRITLIM